ncbi:cAMP-responsive element-binding protein 2-like protein [Leptotrombidium deliense]|uniref:cAMP-responsive element-binding protein 2-like protein n=1 Tax=Leptotrombidium deliense TaxID=299467 RepID=A0A443SRR3_9ACAR|nr:cAMP-responsive element-binding protein 2-like protein [Leptotrombidium deliense]
MQTGDVNIKAEVVEDEKKCVVLDIACDKKVRVDSSSDNFASRFKQQSNTSRKSRKNRKSSKVDMKAKLERSRQSARECRARKKLRYQYLEDLVTKREKAVLVLHKELETVCN